MEALKDTFTQFDTQPAPPIDGETTADAPTMSARDHQGLRDTQTAPAVVVPPTQLQRVEAQAEPAIYRGPRKRLDYPIMAFIHDAVIVMATLGVANWLYQTEIAANFFSVRSLLIGTLAIVMWGGIFIMADLYKLEKYYQPMREFRQLGGALIMTLFGWAGLFAILGVSLPSMMIVQSVLAMAIMTIGWRLLFQMSQRIPHMQRYNDVKRTVIVGTGSSATQLVRLMNDAVQLNVEPVGIFTDHNALKIGKVPVLGDLQANLREFVVGCNVDTVIVALPNEYYEAQEQTLSALDALPVQTWVLPDYFDLPLSGRHVAELADLPLVDVTPARFNPIGQFLKRSLDIVAAGLALILVAPVMIATAVAIKADSPGPIFFFQERVGKHGKRFKIFKFRSMVINADAMLDKVADRDEVTGRITVHKKRNDPRVTRVGRVIRATSIDELPQLLNVLRGDMTLVGPRPEIIRLVNEYAPWQRRRFAMTQGITGWWQVNSRSDRPCHLATDADLTYIQNYSFLLDMQILLMTIPAVLRGKGAY